LYHNSQNAAQKGNTSTARLLYLQKKTQTNRIAHDWQEINTPTNYIAIIHSKNPLTNSLSV
jgi:hypothetical protein